MQRPPAYPTPLTVPTRKTEIAFDSLQFKHGDEEGESPCAPPNTPSTLGPACDLDFHMKNLRKELDQADHWKR